MSNSIILVFLYALLTPSYALDIKKLEDHKPILNESYKSEKKDGYVAIFMNATCPCSNSYADYINNLKKNFSKYQFYMIHSNKEITKENQIKYFQNLEVQIPVLSDDSLELANEFKALKTPHAYLLSTKGDILFQGGVGDSNKASKMKKEYLKSALNEHSQGKKITKKYARALGCYIPRN